MLFNEKGNQEVFPGDTTCFRSPSYLVDVKKEMSHKQTDRPKNKTAILRNSLTSPSRGFDNKYCLSKKKEQNFTSVEGCNNYLHHCCKVTLIREDI